MICFTKIIHFLNDLTYINNTLTVMIKVFNKYHLH